MDRHVGFRIEQFLDNSTLPARLVEGGTMSRLAGHIPSWMALKMEDEALQQ